ncbi:MAG: hypothetical protein D6776_10740 [Planctomycetota bacterium]|nr:MAG: hypothetical protein D6776_10740 [Planctomycetota bacterium]
MPYAEMQVEVNRMLCTRLFRVLEEEVLLSQAASHGIAARTRLAERFEKELVEPLRSGKYQKGTKEPLRSRLGALDALEFAVAAVDRPTARARMREVSELDGAIGRTAAFMYAVMDRYRPFDSWDRITGAYYVVVPFLFESRNHAG